MPLVLCAGCFTRTPLVDLAAQAAGAGFDAITLWARNVRRARERDSLDDRDVRALLADHGLGLVAVEGCGDWVPGTPPGADLAGDAILDAAAALGAAGVLAFHGGAGPGGPIGELIEPFAALCDRAGERGLRVYLEYLPWSGLRDSAHAAQVVREAGRANASLVLDTWHHRRGASPDGPLGAPIGFVQLADGPVVPAAGDVLQETMWHRLVPGEGDLDLVGLLAGAGVGPEVPVGVEVFNEALEAVPPPSRAATLAAACRAVLERVFA